LAALFVPAVSPAAPSVTNTTNAGRSLSAPCLPSITAFAMTSAFL
jgi:hypothetical protein